MRHAIVSDVHANLEALTAVFRALDRQRVDRVVCLGDIVGYNADANECIDLLRGARASVVAGNHDRAATSDEPPVLFSRTARTALRWTKRRLRDDAREWLAALPTFKIEAAGFFLVHASLDPAPNEDNYISTVLDAEASFEAMDRFGFEPRIGFFGHTHRPVVYRSTKIEVDRIYGREVPLEGPARWLVNPGSVGVSRDADPRAAFAVFDDATNVVSFHRAAYDFAKTHRKVEAAAMGEVILAHAR